jgi:hypothetical protein
MNKIKIAIAALALVGTVSAAFAFNTAKFPANLWYKSTTVCKPANATTTNTGTIVGNPTDFVQGYFLTSACTGTTNIGYVPSAQ